MSIFVMSRVWQGSQHSGTELLMMLCLADYSDDDGNSYPAVATLAKRCRMQPRNANYILKSLQDSGELQVRPNDGPKGTNRYRIVLSSLRDQDAPSALKGVQSSAGVQSLAGVQCSAPTPAMECAKPLQPIADEPSLNRQEPEKARAKRSAADQGSRLSAEWVLPADWQTWARSERPELDPLKLAERFKDHWLAQPGAKGRKANWLSTWRNWVRNERAPAGRSGAAASGPADIFGAGR